MSYFELRGVFSNYGDFIVGDSMIERLEESTKKTSAEIANHLRTRLATISNAFEYKDYLGNDVSKDEAYYVWISTGLTDYVHDIGEPLYIGFVKEKNCQDLKDVRKYFCYRISTYPSLEKNLSKWNAGEVPMEKMAKTVLNNQIYNMLLVREGWDILPDNKLIGELLKLIEAKIENDIERNVDVSAYCAFNKDNDKLIYNTGLINQYGKDILIMAELDSRGDISTRKIVLSKTQMIQNGFSKTDVFPVKFYENRKDLIFNATIDDFDLDDITRIRHVVEHRRDRFPEYAKNMSDDELVGKIQSSLEFDLKMTVRNPYWAAPFYNIKSNEIHYLLPLFLRSFSDKPDLAMVVSMGDHFYEVKTVLPLESAYANAACLVSPPSAWL